MDGEPLRTRRRDGGGLAFAAPPTRQLAARGAGALASIQYESETSDKSKGHSALFDRRDGPYLEWNAPAVPAHLAPTGRNSDKLSRAIGKLRLTDNEKVATPANWKPGGDVVILLTIRSKEADKLFSMVYRELDQYVRKHRNPARKSAAGAARSSTATE